MKGLPLWSRLFRGETRSGARGQGSVAYAPLAAAGSCVAAALALGGCAQGPQRFAHGSEYFPTSIYGAASPRVVADGEAVPHGGGRYLVGHPYTVAGRTYYPGLRHKHLVQVGYASWYGAAFHGRRTANGEIFDRNSISAAHPTMPLPSYARVTNLRNHYSMIVRVNDRGPFAPGRIMDVSRRVADLLDFRRNGTTLIKVEYVGPASLEGSDDAKLASTLRIDDHAAPRGLPTMLAESDPVLRNAVAEENYVPQKVAYAQQAAQQDAAAENVSEDVPLPPERHFAGRAPLPPARPFDLGTIPGAGVPIGETASR